MRNAVLLILALLSGCAWLGRQADAIGSVLPVIGERCEHWQCVTDEGREKSEAIKAAKEQENASPPRPKYMPREDEEIAPDASASRGAAPSPGNSERRPFPNPSPVVP